MDTKKISFPQPIAELSTFSFVFKKNNEQLYNFQGRDHMMLFSILASDINSTNRF